MKDTKLNRDLFWDIDYNNLDYERNARFIIGRVLNKGDLPDWYTIKKIYGLKRKKNQMLHYEAIYPETLELLNNLSNKNELEQFFLVGVTAVALHIGHRISADLDFFTKENINTDNLKLFLRNNYDLIKTNADVNTFAFISLLSNIPRENFLCYTTKQSILKHRDFISVTIWTSHFN